MVEATACIKGYGVHRNNNALCSLSYALTERSMLSAPSWISGENADARQHENTVKMTSSNVQAIIGVIIKMRIQVI